MVHHQCHRWKTCLHMDHVSWLQTSGNKPSSLQAPSTYHLVFYYEIKSHVLSAPWLALYMPFNLCTLISCLLMGGLLLAMSLLGWLLYESLAIYVAFFFKLNFPWPQLHNAQPSHYKYEPCQRAENTKYFFVSCLHFLVGLPFSNYWSESKVFLYKT